MLGNSIILWVRDFRAPGVFFQGHNVQKGGAVQMRVGWGLVLGDLVATVAFMGSLCFAPPARARLLADLGSSSLTA